MTKAKKKTQQQRKAAPVAVSHEAIALCCIVFVVTMVGAAYAAVPLYNWFCRTTGFGGTPLVAKVAPAAPIGRKITVRFDGNVAGGLPWIFKPETTSIVLHIGETKLFHYSAKSFGSKKTEGVAAYNISPPEAAGYFNKLQCFCFTNQTLDPGEKLDMPVVFFIDPAIDKDPEFRTLDTITLSYTFFPVKKPSKPVAAVEGESQIR
jgi:cytochrome c oxidase assembly protein subunit 11